jgi:hypothetical protein
MLKLYDRFEKLFFNDLLQCFDLVLLRYQILNYYQIYKIDYLSILYEHVFEKLKYLQLLFSIGVLFQF